MEKKDSKVKLSPPWDSYMQMLKSFFAGDDRFTVDADTRPGKKGVVHGCIRVNDADAYIALSAVLANQKFGKVTLAIDVVPEDCIAAKIDKKLKAGKKFTPLAALKEVMKKNPAFVGLKTVKSELATVTFCVFRPFVVQWYNDNIGSPWKITTSTFEQQAYDVFVDEVGVLFCTKPE